MNNLSLNFFTSTLGHFKCKNVYKYTLDDLYKKSSIFKDNTYKIAHIKVSPEELEIGAKMEQDLYDNFKFNKVIKTIANWSHSDGSSHTEYLKDINTLYSSGDLYNIKYGLHLEDDFIHLVDKLDSLIEDGLLILNNNPNLLTFRYIREDDNDIADRTEAVCREGLYYQSKEFSFNPTFIRNRDMYFISKFTLRNRFNGHCERDFGLSANYLNSTESNIGFYGNYFSFSPLKIVEHIGWLEKIEKYNIS